MIRILAINPGSTSTKIAVYEEEQLLWREEVLHGYEEITAFATIYDQYEIRKKAVIDSFEKHGTKPETLSAIVGRGGPAMPFLSGGYRMNQALYDVLRNHPLNNHISLLGGILAYRMAEPLRIPSFIYDSVSTDELDDVARLSGLKGLDRPSAGHFLNMRAAAHKVAARIGKKVEDCDFIIAHLGGGITIGALHRGKMIEMISDDEGPFSPERTGALPLRSFLHYLDLHDKEEVRRQVRGKGGVVSYLGTTDLREVERRMEADDTDAELVFHALAYQIARYTASLLPVLYGKTDGILFTGGLAYSERLMSVLRERMDRLGNIFVIPGENELEALSLGALRVLRGEETAHIL